MAAALPVIGIVASIGGSLLSAQGAMQQAAYQEAAFKAQAQQQEATAKINEQRAQEERATAQREAVRRGKEAAFMLSRQQALSAASGGGSADTSVLNLMAGTKQEGDYQAQSAVYEGETIGKGLEFQADLDRQGAAISRMQGQAAKKAGFIDAAGAILGGISSFARYSPSMPTYQSSGTFY